MARLALPHRRRTQRGVTLIEALVALLVMSFGMLALVGLMSNLRLGADIAKQRSEAMRIARAALAEVRDYSELTRTASTPATAHTFDDIISKPAVDITPPDSNTTYTVTRTVQPLPTAGTGVSVRVHVSWVDRAGSATAQFVTLDTVIAKADPVFRAVVGLAPQNGRIADTSGRNPAIPGDALKYDKQLSLYRPSSLGSTIWVFNNLSGALVGRCSNSTALADLTQSEVNQCNGTATGHLLRGTVRFSNTDPANPTLPEATALRLDLDFQGGSYAMPRLDAAGLPMRDSAGVILTDSYTATPPTPVGGTQPNFECFNDSPTGSPGTQTAVNYACVIFQSTGAFSWSGKVVLTGFPTGTASTNYRVCRYSADYNGSGDMYTADKKALDNSEHPEVYGRVNGPLIGQNFLVIRGDRTCPTAPAVDLANGVFADYSTVQLQP
ncbi:MAG: prepilin-type N-terminal cleavage/methylation domain-containing protein [Methylotenera sp.]|jgi:Tfp pilus assembly protein PilV|nr:prepilin-type N-terminal cleavage/methylation domain-containing protein [Methylotenera sp.]